MRKYNKLIVREDGKCYTELLSRNKMRIPYFEDSDTLRDYRVYVCDNDNKVHVDYIRREREASINGKRYDDFMYKDIVSLDGWRKNNFDGRVYLIKKVRQALGVAENDLIQINVTDKGFILSKGEFDEQKKQIKSR